MRCHYLSDLHLESQVFPWTLPTGEVLIIAGDLCHASCLDPKRTDRYALEQRTRVLRFLEAARSNFALVIMVAGNHEHYDGVFEDTTSLLRRHLRGIQVLDNQALDYGGVRFFGSTLWSDFEGACINCLNGTRRRMGEFFFVRRRRRTPDGQETFVKFQPEDALEAHRTAWRTLMQESAAPRMGAFVVITHHAPSRQGLNPKFAGNGLDGAFASSLDTEIAALGGVEFWVHGHTHVRKSYRIGQTRVLANCRGLDGKDGVPGFTPRTSFEVETSAVLRATANKA